MSDKNLDRVSWTGVAIGVCIMLLGAVYRAFHSPVLDMRVVKGPAVAISTHIIIVGAAVAICVPAIVVAIQVATRILRRK